MERTKTAKKSEVKWINKGGRFKMADGTLIERGKTFMATPDQVPKAFRDVIKPVDTIPKEVEVEPAINIYTAKARQDGLFDIVDPRNKVINDKPLAEAEAQEVLSRLNG